MHSLDKNLIKERFEKNLSTYTDNAVVQKHMASELMASLYKYTPHPIFQALVPRAEKSPLPQGARESSAEQKPLFTQILEIGCGTGNLTKEIIAQLEFEQLFVNDIVENSLDIQNLLEKYPPPKSEISTPPQGRGNTLSRSYNLTELYGDCEKISFPQNLDLIISNATFQWMQNLPAFLDKAHLSLNNGGILAFSTFEDWNLYQISTLTQKSLNYYTKSDLEEILKQNFRIISSHSQTMEIEFDSAQEVLKHLKLTGVNSLGTSAWTKSDLQNFSEKYQHLFRNEKGKLVLTYKPVWFICGKIN